MSELMDEAMGSNWNKPSDDWLGMINEKRRSIWKKWHLN